MGKYYFLAGMFQLEGRPRTRHKGVIPPKFLRRPVQLAENHGKGERNYPTMKNCFLLVDIGAAFA